MSPEIPQCCPTCHDERVIMTKPAGAGHSDDLAEYEPCPDCKGHTAPVPAPEPAICLHCGIIIGVGRNRLCNACLLSLIDGPCSKPPCEHDLAKTKPAAAPTGTPACPKCGPNAVCDHQGWVYNPDERLKEMREKKTAPTGTGEGSEPRWFNLQTSKDAAPGPLQIPWSIAEKAYSVYAARYGREQSLERLHQRGGFSVGEMDMFHPAWREEVSEIAALRSQLAEAQKYNAHFCAATGPMDEFDTYEDAIQRIKDVRSQLEGAKHAFQQAHMWKMENAKRADKAERDLATAQARIARLEEALTKLSKGNRSPGVLKIARAALAEPQSGDK